MGRFGEHLKSEREARGITLEEITAKTRVSVRLLSAIESERFDLLPGGVFNVSFVRQYARHVGLDEDEVVSEFNKLARPIELSLTESTAKAEDVGASENTGATLAESITEYIRRYRSALPTIFVALALAAVAAIIISSEEEPKEPDETPRVEVSAPPVETSVEDPGPLLPAPPPVAPAPAPEPPPAEPEPRASKPVLVEISITDTVWIRAAADGRELFQYTFRPGETRSIEAEDSVQLLVGNAGGVTVALNGKTMPPIGPLGHVRRVVLTPAGMEIVPPPEDSEQSDAASSEAMQTQAKQPPGNGPPALVRVKRSP